LYLRLLEEIVENCHSLARITIPVLSLRGTVIHIRGGVGPEEDLLLLLKTALTKVIGQHLGKMTLAKARLTIKIDTHGLGATRDNMGINPDASITSLPQTGHHSPQPRPSGGVIRNGPEECRVLSTFLNEGIDLTIGTNRNRSFLTFERVKVMVDLGNPLHETISPGEQGLINGKTHSLTHCIEHTEGQRRRELSNSIHTLNCRREMNDKILQEVEDAFLLVTEYDKGRGEYRN